MVHKAAVASLVVTVLLFVSCAHAQEATSPQPVRIGGLELSGAIAVNGGLLLVDDEQVGSLLFAPKAGLSEAPLLTTQVRLERRRRSSRPYTPLPKLFAVQDIEDLAGDGDKTVYVLGSHGPRVSKSGVARRPDREFIIRAKWDPKARELRVRTPQDSKGREGLYTNLIDDLSRACSAPIGSSINAEGLALRGKRTLFVGLRAPLTSEGKALVFRTDADGLFGKPAERKKRSFQALEIDLGGAGVRALHWDRRADVLLIVSGPAVDGRKRTPFTLWAFAPQAGKLDRVHAFTKAERRAIGSPEGVCRISDTTLLVAGDKEGSGGGGLLRLRWPR